MKTITYNEQTHRLVPVEPTAEMLRKAAKVDLGKDCDEEGICCNLYQAMLSAAPVFDHGDDIATQEAVADASAARIKELETRLTKALTILDAETQIEAETNLAALRKKVQMAREALETCTPEGFCDYDACSLALATIGDE